MPNATKSSLVAAIGSNSYSYLCTGIHTFCTAGGTVDMLMVVQALARARAGTGIRHPLLCALGVSCSHQSAGGHLMQEMSRAHASSEGGQAGDDDFEEALLVGGASLTAMYLSSIASADAQSLLAGIPSSQQVSI